MYLVADHMYWNGADFAAVKSMEADAITAFHGFDPAWGAVQAVPETDFTNRPVTAWARAADTLIYEPIRKGFVWNAGARAIHPGISPQYDDGSWPGNHAGRESRGDCGNNCGDCA